MHLDLFNNLTKYTKENNIIEKFIKELNRTLEKNTEAKQSLLQKIQTDKNITTEYRDKMHIERSKILNQYAKETKEKGPMYFVYSQNNQKNTYLISKQGEEGVVIEVKSNELPKGVRVDSILRKENSEYKLDLKATEEVSNQISNMVEKLLDEQAKVLEERRIEGHLYEVTEKLQNKVALIDITFDSESGEIFEETNIPQELAEKISEGTILQYTNGKYQFNSK